jgi:outer membrane protein assembly factor BamB
MAALRETAKDLWNNYRLATIAAVATVIALLGGMVAAYLLLKRPSDVLDADAPFVAEERRASNRSVDWPTYGYDNERTRYLPSKGLKPPFRKLWGYDAKELLEYSPIIVGGVIYGLNKDADAFAIHGKTGQVLWERRIGRLNASSFTYGHDRLYNVNLQPQQALAVDPATGKTIWKRELPGRLESSPVIYRNRVILGCECGTLYALDGATGKTIWQTDLAGEVKAAPSLKGGIVYVGDYGSEMWAIRARDGGVKWRASGQSQGFARSGRFYAAPAIAFGRVYAGNVDGRMYSFQADSGELAWSQSTGGYVYAAPAVADTPDSPPTVYFGSFDGTFYALDARTGEERWTADLGGVISGAASVIGEIVYVSNLDATETVGYRAENGRKVFEIDSGAYNPMISDGRRLYLTGFTSLAAFEPEDPARTRKQKLRAQGKLDATAGQGKNAKKDKGGKKD